MHTLTLYVSKPNGQITTFDKSERFQKNTNIYSYGNWNTPKKRFVQDISNQITALLCCQRKQTDFVKREKT